MNFVARGKQATRVSASGLTVLTSAACVLEGLWVASVLTAQIVELYQGNTGVTPIIGTSTMVANTFFDIPVSCPTGLTYRVTNEDVDLTLFWSPASS